jgi:hypothetical protein
MRGKIVVTSLTPTLNFFWPLVIGPMSSPGEVYPVIFSRGSYKISNTICGLVDYSLESDQLKIFQCYFQIVDSKCAATIDVLTSTPHTPLDDL